MQALLMARRLRPDVAFIDSYLPHGTGLSGIPLSHSAGLDTAQVITAEIPSVRAVLVDGGEAGRVFPEDAESIMLKPSQCGDGDTVPSGPQAPFEFASLVAGPAHHHGRSFSDTCLAAGILGLLAGLMLSVTIFLAYVGFPLMVLGFGAIVTGGAGKLIASLRHKVAVLDHSTGEASR